MKSSRESDEEIDLQKLLNTIIITIKMQILRSVFTSGENATCTKKIFLISFGSFNFR